ncbi:hypothetical protein EDB19DRAFT_1826700 [Suillus lakei]|nr:hypothetical protein EDB19DRAFT_1826700 [Suillus lakei]
MDNPMPEPLSSSTPNPFAHPEITIRASDVKRNDRGRIIPKLPVELKMGFLIECGQTDFDDTREYGDWVPQIHPDGALYYFDSKRNDYFDKHGRLTGFPCNTCELVLERIDTHGCGYYFVEPGKRCLLWLTAVPSGVITRDLQRVRSYGQLSQDAVSNMPWRLNIGELSFVRRTHCMFFPNNWSLTTIVLAELQKMILHAVADSIASTTSVVPFDQEELAKMLDLTDRLKGEPDGAIRQVNFTSFHPTVTHIRLQRASWRTSINLTALAKFFNFCGQPGARLNSDQSIFKKQKPRHSLFIQIVSLCLFWAPCDYAKELDGIWVDKVINRVLWKQFIAKLNDDWSSLALTATVVLNANVAFLALVGDACAKNIHVGVVVLGLILIRQNQRKDQNSAEQANILLTRTSHPVFGTEPLAIIFSLPYALLMWSMVFFVISFACMVFHSATPVTQGAFSVAGGLICVFVFWTVWTTRAASEQKGTLGSN